MNATREKEIARRLASVEVPEPPPELLERLKAEIPPRLELVPPVVQDRPTGGASPRRLPRRWLAAASLVVAAGGALLAHRVLERGGSPATAVPESTVGQRTPVASDVAPPQQPSAEPETRREVHQRAALAGEGTEAEDLGRRASTKTELDAAVPPTAVERRRREPAQDAGGSQDELAEQPAPPPPPPAPRFEPPRPQGNPAPAEPEAPMMLREGNPYSRPSDAQAGRSGRLDGDDLRAFSDSSHAALREEGAAVPAPRRQRREGEEEAKRPAPPSPSTGGTAEPNDQPYGDVFFRHTGTNPFIDTEEDRLSTFGLDVDSGSYTIARRYLSDGQLPPPESVRVEEWVNAFDYGDQAPRRDDFALHAEGAPSPFAGGERYRLLRFAVQGRRIDIRDRRPAVLVFVVDVSGSMDRENRLGLVKQSLRLLLDELTHRDRVGLVVFGDRGEVLLEPTADRDRIRGAIERLVPGGSTNAEEGLVLGYELAGRHYREGSLNRVILCSDGVANVGRTGPESILERIRREASRGIELTTLGFGMGNYNDVLMEQLADRGNGRYAYLDTLEEARRVLVEDLTGTLQTIAFEARAQVEFEPRAVERYRLLGYENRDIADHRFRDDTVDAGEIGAGHAVTALYEVKLREEVGRGDRLAILRLRYRAAAGGGFEEVSEELHAGDLVESWSEASRALRLAAVVAEMAEILKGTYWARGGDLEQVFRLAQQVSAQFPGDERVAELAALAGKAARLQRPGRP